MGLDMWFYEVPKGKSPKSGNTTEIAYFHKHSDLHGWLEEEWKKDQPEDSDAVFNCVFLEVDGDLLDKMEAWLATPDKKHYSGFYWGASHSEDWPETYKLIPKMREILARGDQVYYYSWW